MRAVEELVTARLFAGAYDGASVFVTGHTGFKGSWLCEWLLAMGAKVTGYSDVVADGPTMFDAVGLAGRIIHVLGDVRDGAALTAAIDAARPNYVFHLAAQPLVHLSFAEPAPTFDTNIMGTVNVMEGLRVLDRPAACVLVTSDKCYENREVMSGYREDDPMGGFDPYSASKGAAEIAIHAYRRSFFMGAKSRVRIGSGRAGNVIGGGDWSADRIVPDCARSLMEGRPIAVRNPFATRPWQHVLEPLAGYMLLAERLFEDGQRWAQAWNFGPHDTDARPVSWIARQLIQSLGSSSECRSDDSNQPHEAQALKLDCSKARQELGWSPVWTLAECLADIASWHTAFVRGDDVRATSVKSIEKFEESAQL